MHLVFVCFLPFALKVVTSAYALPHCIVVNVK